MIAAIKKKLVVYRNLFIYKKFDYLSKINQSKLCTNLNAGFVVSIASYPKRDPLLPAVFEALSRQTVKPKKWILVLSEEDYYQGLPNYLTKLEKFGVEILWVKNNPYAVKKLIPVIEKYPDIGIVTLDDDIIYHSSLLEGLITEANNSPNSIIGYVGKAMVRKDNKLQMYYREKTSASIKTPTEQVYLIGWGGIYYSPNSLDGKVLNMNAVHRIVPGRGSDIWFWAAAHATVNKQICLGMPTAYNLGIPIQILEQTKPKDTPGGNVMEKRFQMAIDYFEIREKLIAVLPNVN